MSRALLSLLVCACSLVACGEDPPAPGPANPSPMNDAQITPVLEGGALEDHITVPVDPRDGAITEPTPILDLPLVIARPNEPLSTARLEVLVIAPDGPPIADVSISTGGPAVFTSAFGLASVVDVYGTDFTNVYAFGAGRTLSHARIPIRAGATSYAVLVMAERQMRRLDDLAAGGSFAVEAGSASATFEAASFELPWGGSAKGPGMVGMTVLAEPEEAAAVPGGMQARVAGEWIQVTGVMALELSVAQGSTELELIKEADVTLSLPAHVSTVDAAALTLYFFDAKVGAFVSRGSPEPDAVDPTVVHFKIDRTGSWLIGAAAGAVRCARSVVQRGSSPLARAGVVLTLPAGFSAARVEADDTGAGCAVMPEQATYNAHALGQLGDGTFVTVAGAIAAGASAACDETCEATVLEGEPLAIGCVKGTISIPWLFGSEISAVEVDSSGERARTLPLNTGFCVDGRLGAQLTINPGVPAGMCTGGGVISVSAPAAPGSSCGTNSDCVDVGTITCCMVSETCLNNSDDDCDGQVDEGCVCGGADCTLNPVADRCCATADRCGQRSTITSECVGYEGFGIPIGCPTATVPGLAGDTELVQGCCRTVGECGLMWGSVGCVAAADVPRVWGAETTLASIECTP